MTELLLTTKLYFPPARANLVSRPRLIEVLTTGLSKPLTLISAPAGYGKTTLLGDWRARYGRELPFAWLSLGSEDDHLARFLTYVSAALATLDPNLTQAFNPLLHLPQLPPIEELITVLINGVNAYPQDFALVLDDFHVITEPAIHNALAFLLDHPPPRLHVVLLTRSDPPIPLARLRARGHLVELRTADLRFNLDETGAFLNGVMDLKLSGENVSALDQRTEGWIVGLQMAALSMQRKADPNVFIQAFTGSNRYILDFLSEEVLQQQPESIQTFLLQTSILDRLNDSLCDAVLGGSKCSSQIIVELERNNLFLIPLDDDRQWYRYHHLFAELLFQRLKQKKPEMVNTLYERAANWHEQHGYLEYAVGYALKAQNFDLATRLMNLIKDKLWGRAEIHVVLNWLNTLPENLVRSQPELCLVNAVCSTMEGYFETAETWFRLAEEGYRSIEVSDHLLEIRIRVIPVYRSIFARFHRDYYGAIALCQRVLDQTPVTEFRPMAVALLFLGQAHFYAGNMVPAEQVLTDAIQNSLASNHLSAYMNACHHMAKLRVLQGRLQDARVIYEQANRVASEQGTPIYAGTEYAGLGDLEREWNQLHSAAIDIQKGVELAETGDHIFFLIDVYLAGLRLAMAQMDWGTAWRYLQKAEQVARRCPTSIENEHIHNWWARLQLAQGNLVEAGRWAETKAKEESAGSWDLQREFTLLTLARVWLAQGKTDHAAFLLERIRLVAEGAGRLGRALEAQMLQALVEETAGEETQAIETLSQVLVQAEPEGYVRLFIDESAPMAKLLHQVSTQKNNKVRDYARRLLEASSWVQSEAPSTAGKAIKDDARVALLSKREIEVLQLMADGCANKEIASQLIISTGTVKRHIVHIFQKLDAASRTQAVAIARERKII